MSHLAKTEERVIRLVVGLRGFGGSVEDLGGLKRVLDSRNILADEFRIEKNQITGSNLVISDELKRTLNNCLFSTLFKDSHKKTLPFLCI